MPDSARLPVPGDLGDLSRIDRLFDLQKANCGAVRLTSAKERIAKLRRLEDVVFRNRQAARDAIWADFRKSPEEVDVTETFVILSEIRHTVRHLRGWMKPRRVPTPLSMFGASCKVLREPKGVALIVSPWNYPLLLALGPLVSAVAAGNCVVLKPSELTPATSALVRSIVAEVFDENEAAVVEGDATTAQALLKKRWDHIFFTGSTAVGRIVMKAAAEHLTPITLELGGKSPVFVDASADLDMAARKIAWGKLLNGGQICMAPDYVLVERSVESALVERLKRELATLWSAKEDGSPSIACVVNKRHFERLSRLIDDAASRGAKVFRLGESKPEINYLAPAILTNLPPDAAIMQEEIFGPLLPVFTWDKLEDAIKFVVSREKPLSLYIFTGRADVRERILSTTSAGGGCVGDTILHFANPYMPFGGFGESGMGRAHGVHGFDEFTNERAVIFRPPLLMKFLYPPYGRLAKTLSEIMLRWL